MALDFAQFGSFAAAANPIGGALTAAGALKPQDTPSANQVTPTITIGGLRSSGGQSVSARASQESGLPSSYGGESGFGTSVPGASIGVGMWVAIGAVALLAFGTLLLSVKR